MHTRKFSSRSMFAFFVAILILAGMSCAAPSASNPAPSAPNPTQAEAPSAPEPTEIAPVVEVTAMPTMTASPAMKPIQAAPAPAIPETRRLTLEFPSRIRDGQADVVRLTLEVDTLGNITPTAEIAGNKVVGKTIEIPDLYETHNVTAEARLDLAGMTIQPPNSIYEPLKRGQSATFYWSILPQDTGKYRGTVWLHLNFADKATGEQNRIAVSAQIIEIEAVDFFGLSVNLARTSGVIGSVVGGVVGFPFLEDIIKFLFKRRKKS